MDQPPRLPDDVDRAIEAVVMVADQPIEPNMLAQLLEIPVSEVIERCVGLAAQYEIEGRGFQLVRVAGGYRYQSHPDQVAYVERFVLDGQSNKLSAAALETLAIVAYKQPISRAQVTAIRGVNVDGVMRTLVQRGLVTEMGTDPGPGQAILYGTTPLFLERLSLDRVQDLPPLGQFVPDGMVLETIERTLLADGDPRRRTRTPAPTDPETSDPDEIAADPADAEMTDAIDLTEAEMTDTADADVIDLTNSDLIDLTDLTDGADQQVRAHGVPGDRAAE
ncbi:MAG: SMC-Scp complex subunit ScpB [Acidimicrobiales bacterium]